ncbi:MAG TPA: Uma2 family endonuclease [Candidatus Binatia bacterium]|jgi:Uma2 family endonuclease|nr:Uma2 family endonuclease [Candidatus Binatia bacterium]
MVSRSSVAPAVHRFTRDEYYRMAEAGLFRDERVELLDGEIITMSPQLTPHASTVNLLMSELITRLGAVALVRGQSPIVLNDWSEPEPDIAVCHPDPGRYLQAHPRADQVFLVIEVADTSLAYDRTRKARAYAASGIPEYWIINLPDRKIEVLTDPDPAAQLYRQQRAVFSGDVLALPNGSTIAADDILP